MRRLHRMVKGQQPLASPPQPNDLHTLLLCVYSIIVVPPSRAARIAAVPRFRKKEKLRPSDSLAAFLFLSMHRAAARSGLSRTHESALPRRPPYEYARASVASLGLTSEPEATGDTGRSPAEGARPRRCHPRPQAPFGADGGHVIDFRYALSLDATFLLHYTPSNGCIQGGRGRDGGGW
jgi:hypothetical protein